MGEETTAFAGCPQCEGRGRADVGVWYEDVVQCPKCQGTGKVDVDDVPNDLDVWVNLLTFVADDARTMLFFGLCALMAGVMGYSIEKTLAAGDAVSSGEFFGFLLALLGVLALFPFRPTKIWSKGNNVYLPKTIIGLLYVDRVKLPFGELRKVEVSYRFPWTHKPKGVYVYTTNFKADIICMVSVFGDPRKWNEIIRFFEQSGKRIEPSNWKDRRIILWNDDYVTFGLFLIPMIAVVPSIICTYLYLYWHLDILAFFLIVFFAVITSFILEYTYYKRCQGAEWPADVVEAVPEPNGRPRIMRTADQRMKEWKEKHPGAMKGEK